MFRTALSRVVVPRNPANTRGMATIKEKLNLDKNIEIATQSLKKFAALAVVEMRPPTPAELPKALADGYRLFTKSNWKNITVRQAWLNTLVTTEVICWFFVGEVIGKGSLIGYQV